MWKDLILEGILFGLALWAGLLLYRRTQALESLLSSAPSSPLVINTLDEMEDPHFLLVTSPHVCAVDGQTWAMLTSLAKHEALPVYGWVLARPDLPETSLWLESMDLPFPVRLSLPSKAFLALQSILGQDLWSHLPALLLIYHGRVVAVQPMATLDLEGMVWLYQYLKNRETWPWFY